LTECDLSLLSREALEAEVVQLRSLLHRSVQDKAWKLAAFDSAVEFAIVVTDTDGTITAWNAGAEQVMGWTSTEMLGQDASCFFTPEDRATGRVAYEMQTALRDGRATDERWHLTQSGERFWASGQMMPLRDEHKVHIGFLKIFRDRTAEHLAGKALKDTERLLRQSQETQTANNARYLTLFNAIDDGFCIIEFIDGPEGPLSDYVHVDANLGYERQTGITGIIGQTIRGFAPAEAQGWVDLYKQVWETGQPLRMERYFEAASRDIEVLATRLEPIGKRQVSILFRDISQRKKTEALIRENTRRLQLALAAGAVVGTWFWDIQADRFTVDEAFIHTFGLDPNLGHEHISPDSILETVHPDDREGLSEAVKEALARGGNYAHQYRTRRTDGCYYWIEGNGYVTQAPDGSPQTFPGVLVDIEDRRAVEAERDRANEALRALAETLEQRVEERTRRLQLSEEQLRQAQKMEAVGQLTGGIAHDFNNLLAGIMGSLELMNTRFAQGRLKDIDKYMAAAQGAAKRAAALTHRLLAFSRRQTLDPKTTDVNALVDGMCDLIQRTVGPSVPLHVVGATDLWLVQVDPSQLENALLNLCINARDAMPEGGSITIETANRTIDEQGAARQGMRQGQYLALSVSDTGTGMSAEVIAKAFDPFFTTKPIGQGTGLGLSMIYGFANQSNGQVRIHSTLGQGTTVTIYLPRHKGTLEPEDSRSDPYLLGQAKAGETVLVVEDEPTVRLLVTDVLEDLGYTVIEATESVGGLRVLQSNTRIDLLITDVGLPGGLNGRQLADAARVRRAGLKVLFITGYAENALLSQGQLEPGMSVLTKPFAVEALASRLQQLLSH